MTTGAIGKIGITEQGDAGLDLSWVDKLDGVAGAILITKELTDPFVAQLLAHQNKVLLHMTCTGYGGTVIEPKVPKWATTVQNLKQMIDLGFPVERIVLRVDPIIPTEKGIRLAQAVIEAGYNVGVQRVRISVLDMYKHVQARFQQHGLPLPYGSSFQASREQFAALDRALLQTLCKYPGISLESCAEPQLKVPKRIGCVSDYECQLFKIEKPDSSAKQRQECLCCAEKTELLSNRHPCAHGCLYCYWRN